jgi:hypothetical protein
MQKQSKFFLFIFAHSSMQLDELNLDMYTIFNKIRFFVSKNRETRGSGKPVFKKKVSTGSVQNLF